MKTRKILSLLPALLVLAGCSEGTPKPKTHVHTYEAHEAQAKTCDEDGNKFYYSCECGMVFDENKAETSMQDIIIPFSHELVKFDAKPGFEISEAEHYQCSVCHKWFMDNEGALEVEEGEWFVTGSAVHYAKGETMTTRRVKAVSLAELEGKALAFDFRMVEDGSNILCLGQSDDTYNVSGVFTITKKGNDYSSQGCVITDSALHEGYKTIKMNRTLFTGDGMKLWGANGIDRIFGGWDGAHSCSYAAGSEIYIDPDSFRAVDAYSHEELGPIYVAGCDVDKAMGYKITKTELQGKALSFDVFFGATGNQTIKVSIYKNGWSAPFIPDIFITRNGSTYEARQYATSYPMIPSIITDKGEGWVNVQINAKSLGIQSDYGDTCVVWKSPTTDKNGVDINSFKVVDELDIPNEIIFQHDNFKAYGFEISASELIKHGAVSFNVKPTPNSTVHLSFMVNDLSWSNYGTSKFITDASGKLTITQGIDSSAKGKITELENGWYNVIFNEYDFSGDGRANPDIPVIDRIFVQNGTITIDGDSFEYCAPYAQTGVEYASNTGFHVASWDSAITTHNFSFPKAKFAQTDAGLSFEFKPVGDGTITLTLMGDNWQNLSGNFTITKSGNSVTSNYAGAKIVARANGWYSIYLPSPWNGDGFSRTDWSSFAMIDSAAGYTGTSFSINYNSIHLINKNYLTAI